MATREYNFAVPASVRFLKRIKFRDSCWEWTGHTVGTGYGRFYVKGKPTLAHRYSYWLFVGEIPDGMDVCHRCDNPPCVNPWHLFVGTRSDNVRDCIAKGRNRYANHAGENNPAARLSGVDVAAIRKQSGTIPQAQIATRYGVSVSLVSQIVNRRAWASV